MANDKWEAFMEAIDDAVSRSKAMINDPCAMESIYIPEVANLDALRREVDLMCLFNIDDVTENIALNGKGAYYG